MITELLHDESCRWCGRKLHQSFLAEVADGGIEKNGSRLYPILCVCGGITVIGAGTFVSYFDDVAKFKVTGERYGKEKRHA
jgi:hypothetical protein